MVKIIHQTWVDEDIPRNIYKQEWQDSWKNMSPDWDYMFWTDEDNERLIRDEYPSFWVPFRRLTKE